MEESGRVRRWAAVLGLAPLLLLTVVFPATRSDAADDGDRVPAAQVAEGLKTVQDIAADAAAAAGQDKAKAGKIADGIEAVWSKIEDTVRANDQDAYITFEDSFDTLGAAARAGDAEKAGRAAGKVAAAVKAYVVKFPAEPAPASAAAAPDSAPAARASDAATPAPGPRTAEAAAPAPGPRTAEAAAPAGDAPSANLARTGPHAASGLTALAGAAFGLGGLAVIAGARRRRRLSPTA